MKTVISDVECNGFDDSTKMWLFGGIDADTGERYRFDPFRGEKERKAAVEWANSVDLWVGHSFISYDTEQVNRLVQPGLINPHKVIDTLVVSRLICFDRKVPKGCKSGHSLKAHGIRLGVHKGDFNKFDEFSQEMVDYWEGDLDTTQALYEDFKKYIYDPDWKKSMRCEHDLQIELERQKVYGFAFDKEKAGRLLASVKSRMEKLEEGFAEDFPAQLKVVKTLNYTVRKDGEEGVHVQRAKENHPLTKVDGEHLICYDYIPFKPGSPVDRVDVLWDAGWKPFEKTKTHQLFGRKKVGDPYGKSVASMDQEFYDKKKSHLERYGWTCSEDNLATLPKDAPNGAKNLAAWLTLEGRRSSLVEWLGQVKEDGRIHGSVMGIGAWTGRMAHNGPNTANIAAPFHGTPKNAVDEIKNEYDREMRSCWTVPKGSYLVGVDAEGIQLRILGDWLWRHFDEPSYAETIVNGRKEDETDIHNVNKKALGLSHVSRDDAKTFIYAWVLNAGLPKIASILRTQVPTASSAKTQFENSIAGLKPFKEDLLPFIADRGWFAGYDGRKVIVPSLHKTLAGILQNGEKCVMAHSRLLWAKELNASQINYKPVGLIHDEFQTEVIGTEEEAEYVKKVQMESIATVGVDLGFKCPLSGKGDIGLNWSETH